MSRITRSAARANDPQPQPTPDDETSSEEEEDESNVLSQSFNSTLSLSQQGAALGLIKFSALDACDFLF
jgi:hypothetical protein